MKAIELLVLAIIPMFSMNNLIAQTLNLNSLNSIKHATSAGIGWDYALTYNIGYSYKMPVQKTVLLNSSISLPFGNKILDDFKIKLGGQTLIVDQKEFKGSIILNGLYRRYENPLVRLQNIGFELKSTFGYYKPKWFVAAEVGFDMALTTHFKHSDVFRENIFQDVQDGWYRPTTGGNLYYGLQTGYSFRTSDITFSIGNVISQGFTTKPLIPYYFNLGYIYKI